MTPKKVNLLLISKADLLSWQQRWAWLFHTYSLYSSMDVLNRLSWAEFFSEKGIAAAFWSAQVAAEDNETATVEGEEVGRSDGGEGEREGEGDREVPAVVGSSAELSVRPNLLSQSELLQLFLDLSPVPGKSPSLPPSTPLSVPLYRRAADYCWTGWLPKCREEHHH